MGDVKSSFRIRAFWTEIRTRDFPNTKQGDNHLATTFDTMLNDLNRIRVEENDF